MQLFYTSQIDNNTIILSEEEAKHCIQVLRLNKNDRISVTDGKGNLFEAEISETNKKKCTAEIISVRKEFGKRDYHIHIAIAPTKQNERFEWFLEKAVELGVDEITPVLCDHSERRTLNMERMNKVILSAMKQSLKAYLPVLNNTLSFQDFLSVNLPALKFICSMTADSSSGIDRYYSSGNNLVVAIGPEGDFSKKEMDTAFQNGFKAITLGDRRLRTETAGIIACSHIHFINND